MSKSSIKTESRISPIDQPYEDELARYPYSVRTWLQYIEHKQHGDFEDLCHVYERALDQLPGSYKLWKQYLDLRREKLQGAHPIHSKERYQEMNHSYEKALVLLNKMPRIWLDYLQFLTTQPIITTTRRTFDRALRALPVTQHDRIWEVYLEFAQAAGPETAIRVIRRYLKLEPQHVENYIDLLVKIEHFDEAAQKLVQVVNDHQFKSIRGKSNYQLWQDLCDLVVEHCNDIHSIQVEAIIRSGIQRFTDQVGLLYCRLAMYWIKMGQLEKARDIFEEGITTVVTVRDFTAIFDAYAEFEEEMISAKMELAAEREASGGESNMEDDLELDIRLARFERLMDRRAFLVNDVLLRQNPNNVSEWEKRVSLWGENRDKVVEAYNQALQTVNPKKAHGKLQTLWINFGRFYEDNGDLDAARAIFDKAVKVNFKAVTDLADVWCEYAELETRHDEFDRALRVMAQATSVPRASNTNKNPRTVNYHDESLPVQQRVFKSLQLWSFYIDLKESVGSVDATKQVYDQVMDLRIANPQVVVNYAVFLEEHQYFEDAFRVYERGIDLFGWPIAFELWNIYLPKFIERYGGSKLERARELFEQALTNCPAKYAKPIYLMYGKLEEEHGLARHAMRIYDRATTNVDDSVRLEMFQFYIAKAAANFGIVSTREIYEKALESLPDKDCRVMVTKFADLERKLGEIDRARAIYGYGSQFFNPKAFPDFWQTWHEFEVKHGSEDTYKEYLRIKRSVQAQFPL
ncbi:TPR-like protein [Hesseltinella vesiculosa]|uniref:Pre-mRNA-splicing factor SYF1 n=1 Tax=Hesseltinella vesiculosa TaxID=101127 RepID=A0A1X2GLV2_9FUNG|nr:TPR-like protein [Hesseltinella vesiculosa]